MEESLVVLLATVVMRSFLLALLAAVHYYAAVHHYAAMHGFWYFKKCLRSSVRNWVLGCTSLTQTLLGVALARWQRSTETELSEFWSHE